MGRRCYLVTRSLSFALMRPFARMHVWAAPGAVDPAGPAVLVANHISHFDPIFLTYACERVIDWMTSAEFYANPLVGGWLRAIQTFPVDRSRPDRRALRVGIEKLHAGRLVGVFPEGGIRAGATSVLGGAAPKSGAAALARLAGTPIIPCVILGSDRLYSKQSWWPGPPRVPVWVAIGTPFSVAGMNSSESDARMTCALRELGASAISHFSLGPDDLPATPQRRKGRDAQAAA